jgi:hypothetical protein
MKFDVDYLNLDQKLTQPKHFSYADVKDRLVKVAFDIVKFRESDAIDGLWQIQQTNDGEIIVATYEDEAEVSKQASAQVAANWEARANAAGDSVTVFYKSEPVTKIATAQYGIPAEDANLVCAYVPEKLASNVDFRKKMLNELSNDDRLELLKKYPELND